MGAAFSYWRKLMTPYNEHKADVLKRL
ncbi:Calcium-transporting ATPase, partial [Lacticaseibacillus paracasei subsp. paracasei Lpp37]